MNTKEHVKLIAEQMDVGTSRHHCPGCNGGSSRERTLSITRFPNSIIKYNCFRGTCIYNVQGSFILAGGHARFSNEERILHRLVQPKRKVFNGVTLPLTDFEKEWIYKAWGIKDPPYWWHTPQYGGRVAMSVRSPKYEHRGWVLRDLEGTARFKALTYLDPKETPLSWYRNKDLEGTIIVEDIPSAVRASTYLNSVALLGVGCGIDRATEIDINAPRPIIIALDQDTTHVSFEIKDRWKLLWGQVKVMPLKFDLKNLQEIDLEDLIMRHM